MPPYTMCHNLMVPHKSENHQVQKPLRIVFVKDYHPNREAIFCKQNMTARSHIDKDNRVAPNH